jgi:hypothetical protein
MVADELVVSDQLSVGKRRANTIEILPCQQGSGFGAVIEAILAILVYTHLPMGRQTRFHMLPEDCRRFVQFLRERDPIIVTKWYSTKSAEIEEVACPWENGGMYCLWNRAILQKLKRHQTGKHFNVEFAAPVIEFSYDAALGPWNGQPALCQGRIWASFETESKSFESWYNAVVRWIRKNFIRDQAVGHRQDSFGPVAYDWYRSGGLLLPSFRPPVTADWLAWVSVQNQHRSTLNSE